MTDKHLLNRMPGMERIALALQEGFGYTPREAVEWLTTPHPLLGGETPVHRIGNGNIEDVEAIIDQILTGAYG